MKHLLLSFFLSCIWFSAVPVQLNLTDNWYICSTCGCMFNTTRGLQRHKAQNPECGNSSITINLTDDEADL